MLILIYDLLVVVLVQVLTVFCCQKKAQQTSLETAILPTAIAEAQESDEANAQAAENNEQKGNSQDSKVPDADCTQISLKKSEKIVEHPTQTSEETAPGYIDEGLFEVVGDLSVQPSMKPGDAVPSDIIQTRETQSASELENNSSSAMASTMLGPGASERVKKHVLKLPTYPKKKHEVGWKELQETQEELIDYHSLEEVPLELSSALSNSEQKHRVGSLGDLIQQVNKAKAERERNEKAASRRAALKSTSKTQNPKETTKVAAPTKASTSLTKRSSTSTSTARSSVSKSTPARTQTAKSILRKPSKTLAMKVQPVKAKPKNKKKSTKKTPVKKKRK